MTNYTPTFTRQNAQELSGKILAERNWSKRAEIVADTLATLPECGKRGTWQYYLRRFQRWCLLVADSSDNVRKVPFAIFRKTGNVKLPFVSFSTLPGFTCPGAGACLKYCYSYRAWRYPAAFLRQLQNSILMQTSGGRALIALSFGKLPVSRKTGKLTLRLYVDGDFSCVDDFTFWMLQIHSRAQCEAYGYSKSWREILQGVAFLPDLEITQYVLNVSGGSIHDDDMKAQIMRLPFARNVFDAVSIDDSGLPSGFAKYESAEYHKRTREAYKAQTGARGFSCPGKCGDCRSSSGTHACGDLQFNIPIMIGVH